MLLGSMWDYSAAINYSTFTFIVDTKQSNKVSASFSEHVKSPETQIVFHSFGITERMGTVVYHPIILYHITHVVSY